MKQLLWLLLAFFCPHAEPGEAEPEPEPEAPEGEQDELDLDPDPEPEAEPEAEPETQVASKPARSAESDDAREAIRVAREAQEAVQRLTPPRTDPTFEAEEQRLKNPETTELEKWQIQSNRALRESQQQSRQALFQAADMADKTSYQAKAIGDPRYKKYEDRVEKELASARSKGANPPREMVLAVMIGRDVLAKQFKATTKPAAVNRGKPNTSVRSDTTGRNGATASQKLRARLENQSI